MLSLMLILRLFFRPLNLVFVESDISASMPTLVRREQSKVRRKKLALAAGKSFHFDVGEKFCRFFDHLEIPLHLLFNFARQC